MTSTMNPIPSTLPELSQAQPSRNPQGDYVVLLHGLGRTALSMRRFEWALEGAGYRVINVSYPSTRLSVEALADTFLAPLLRSQAGDPNARIHFVTHSLGGIVLRQYLAAHRLNNLDRIVMLAPPNQGSEVAERLNQFRWFRRILGPSAQQLGTGAASLPRRLGPVPGELGVIAGDRSSNPCFSSWMPGPDDGKVSVESTKVEGMKEHRVIHATHTWLMWKRETIEAGMRFLKTGSF